MTASRNGNAVRARKHEREDPASESASRHSTYRYARVFRLQVWRKVRPLAMLLRLEAIEAHFLKACRLHGEVSTLLLLLVVSTDVSKI